MMSGWRYGLLLVALPFWVAVATAGPAEEAATGAAAVSKVPTLTITASSGVKADASPDDDYEAAVRKADEKIELMDAIPLFKRAADHGHAKAQARIADIFHQSGYIEQSVEYYRKSAEQGNPEGQFGLGNAFEMGEGVKQDHVEARRLIALAAKQGHKQAIGSIAFAYIRGGLGLDENARQSSEALDWIKFAADNGYALAMDALADAYRLGQYGLAADSKQADEWVVKARKARGIAEEKKKSSKKRF